jgi:hypothetical protein
MQCCAEAKRLKLSLLIGHYAGVRHGILPRDVAHGESTSRRQP